MCNPIIAAPGRLGDRPAACRHGGDTVHPCQAKSGIGERSFRFHREDPRSNCLPLDPRVVGRER